MNRTRMRKIDIGSPEPNSVQGPNHPWRLGLTLGVLVAVRLLVIQYGDPALQASITRRQIFFWADVPGVVCCFALLGVMIGWFSGRIFKARNGARKGVDVSDRRSILAVIAGYMASVGLVNVVERFAFPVSWPVWGGRGGPTGLELSFLLSHLVTVLLGLMVGGYVSVLLSRRQDIKDACLLGVFMMLMGSYQLFGEEPRWLSAITIALPIPGTLIGGWLSLIRQRLELVP